MTTETFLDGPALLRKYKEISVPREVAQRDGTFLIENARRMESYTWQGRREWRMHPSVRQYIHDNWFLSYGIPLHSTLLGIPITLDVSLPELGTEGCVKLICDDCEVRMEG